MDTQIETERRVHQTYGETRSKAFSTICSAPGASFRTFVANYCPPFAPLVTRRPERHYGSRDEEKRGTHTVVWLRFQTVANFCENDDVGDMWRGDERRVQSPREVFEIRVVNSALLPGPGLLTE
ncbi:hypothetical protein ACFE04_000017 [Oxalis oulophora]